MPIADSTLILEGQQDFSGGMDSSLAPTLIGDNSVATAVNVTFRGGRPRSRPGFRQVSLSSGLNQGIDILTDNYFQGSYFYSERRLNYNPSLVGVFGGNVVKIDLGLLTVDRIYPLIPATSITTGKTYTIKTSGNTNWVSLGAPSDDPGEIFTATTTGSGTGTAYEHGVFLDPYEKCYFAQAERYLLIQNGKNTPLIWDGDNLYVSGIGPSGTTGSISQLHTIPPGTIMAYGQGRLFVASADRTEIRAGDIIFGGSTSQVGIDTGAYDNTLKKYVVTTSTNHGFSNGDRVSIYGHTSEWGVNGTWQIADISSNTFSIDLNTADATGSGGFVSKANAGAESDLLRFTETQYLSEGGALQIPSYMGRITAMIFMPVQDTSTGQGDLLVFCERGTASFAVSIPRENWKSTQAFQRVVFQKIGATSYTSVATDNGDVFFRSYDGLRSYRNARAELNSYGQVPLSAEMNSVLAYDTSALLSETSTIIFDNRLLFTASPSINYVGLNPNVTTKQPVTFSKIVALDFTTLSTVGAKRSASYDGIWAGLNVLQLLTGLVNGKPEAFAFSFDFTNQRINTLWKITTNAPYDYPLGVTPQRIQSIIETRSFSFGTPTEQKRMLRADFWISDLTGVFDASIYWRPDQYPCWRLWHSFSRCATTDKCIDPGVTFTVNNNRTSSLCFSDKSPASFFYRLGANGKFTELIQYSFAATPTEQENDLKNALTAAGFTVSYVARSGEFPNYCFTIGTPVLPNWEGYTEVPFNRWDQMTTNWEAPYSPNETGLGLELTFVPAKAAADTSCLSNFTVRNLQPQYRPQIRMPTPPEDSDPIISRPYYYGNDFQLRMEFSGHFELNRILMLGQRILEQYQGTDRLEVL